MRLANAATTTARGILRRGYSYNDGVNFTAERWPPWRQGMEYDAGLLFVCYQRDPRTGFIKIFENMAKFDMLNQFATHIGGGLFACPPASNQGNWYRPGSVPGRMSLLPAPLVLMADCLTHCRRAPRRSSLAYNFEQIGR